MRAILTAHAVGYYYAAPAGAESTAASYIELTLDSSRDTSEDMTVEITSLGAGEIADKIIAGEFTARDAVEAHIQRIEAVHPKLNAVVVPLFDQARAEAVSADNARRQGKPVGPLHGVPITIKESFDVAGTAATMGLSERTGHKATEDAPLVARLRRAGAIILGKSNVPQLLMAAESDNPVYGRTNNPWNPERAPGGSSGGCAAIIAAGGSALGMGSDIGGSIRNPAHACGIHGFKPTSGRLTMLGHAEIFPGQEAILCQPGPLARNVADLVLAMKVLAAPGQEDFDPSIAPVPVGDPAAIKSNNLRVAIYIDNGLMKAAPALRRAVGEAANALRERGVVVEEWTPPDVSEAWQIYLGLLFGDGGVSTRRLLGRSKRDWRINRIVRTAALPRGLISASYWPLKLAGQVRTANAARSLGAVSTDSYWQLAFKRKQYRARFLAELNTNRFDAIICPPDALPALRHGSSFYLSDALSYANLYNLLGMPAGVVAATRVQAGEESDRAPGIDIVELNARKVEAGSAGLPVGVQVAARPWREDIVLALMAMLEEHFKGQPSYPSRPPL